MLLLGATARGHCLRSVCASVGSSPWGATPAEVSRAWPSDALVPAPHFNATRSITIDCTARAGVALAGADGRDSSGLVRLRPARQPRPPQRPADHPGTADPRAGDIVPMSPDGKQGMTVHSMDAPHSMVWGEPGRTTWAWQLDETDSGSTRLIDAVPFALPVVLAVDRVLRPGRVRRHLDDAQDAAEPARARRSSPRDPHSSGPQPPHLRVCPRSGQRMSAGSPIAGLRRLLAGQGMAMNRPPGLHAPHSGSNAPAVRESAPGPSLKVAYVLTVVTVVLLLVVSAGGAFGSGPALPRQPPDHGHVRRTGLDHVAGGGPVVERRLGSRASRFAPRPPALARDAVQRVRSRSAIPQSPGGLTPSLDTLDPASAGEAR